MAEGVQEIIQLQEAADRLILRRRQASMACLTDLNEDLANLF